MEKCTNTHKGKASTRQAIGFIMKPVGMLLLVAGQLAFAGGGTTPSYFVNGKPPTSSNLSSSSASGLLSGSNTDNNPNVNSVIDSLADACTNGNASSRLISDCRDLFLGATTGDPGVPNALRQITPERSLKAARLSYQALLTHKRTIFKRLKYLRSSRRGKTFRGLLSLNLDSQAPSPTNLTPQGGSAGEDNDLFGSRLGGFVTGAITKGSKSGSTLDSGLDFNNRHITAGLDYRVNEHWVLGGAVGYGTNKSNLDNQGGNIHTTNYTFTFYGTYYGNQAQYMDFSLAFGKTHFDQERNLSYTLRGTPINQTASANYGGKLLTMSVGGGYDFNRGPWTFGPHSTLDYVRINVDGFQETMSNPTAPGGGLAASINSTTQTWLTLALGGKASYAHSATWGVLTPYIGADWLHEFRGDSQQIQGGFVNSPNSRNFNLITDNPDRNYFRINLGVTAIFVHGLIGYFDYETILGDSKWKRHTFSLGLRMEF